MSQAKRPDPALVVIFGASGDLTHRKLIPALHSLHCAGRLPDACRVIGVARSQMTDEEFRDRLYEGVVEYSRVNPEVCRIWESCAPGHRYLAGDYDDPSTYRRLAQAIEQVEADAGERVGRLFYLAVPPQLYTVIVARLGEAGLAQA